MLRAEAYLGSDLYGIVVGSDNTPVDILDYKLGVKIVGGTESGQLIYQEPLFDSDVTVSDPDCTFDMWRNWNNNSGGSVTVRETGIYTWTNSDFFCIVRDVPTEITVPDGGGCYVKYTPKITE